MKLCKLPYLHLHCHNASKKGEINAGDLSSQETKKNLKTGLGLVS